MGRTFRNALALVLGLSAVEAVAQEIVSSELTTPAYTVLGAATNYALNFWSMDGVAVADVSADGIPDMVFGGLRATGRGGVVGAGRCHVIFGPLQPSHVHDLAIEPAGLTIFGRDRGEELSESLVVADVDADGQNDLVVGAWSARRPDTSSSRRGAVNIFYGPLSPGEIDLATTEPGLAILGTQRGDCLGASVAVGDVSGDGIADLVMGADREPSSGGTEPGAVMVIFGPVRPGPVRELAVTPPDAVIVGHQFGGMFGWEVALGDVSGDGVLDIAASAYRDAWPAGAMDAGSVSVVFGPLAAGTTRDLRVTPPDVLVTGGDAGDELGRRIETGDMTGDGVAELFIAAPRADGPGDAVLDCGELGVYLGPLASGTVVDNVAAGPDITFVEESLAYLGSDVDHWMSPDGSPHLLISSLQRGVCLAKGSAYWLTRLPAPGVHALSVELPPYTFTGHGSLPFGEHASLGDLTGDGSPEVIVASQYNGVADDRWNAGRLEVMSLEDRCEGPPGPMGPQSLRVRRAGDDVVLDFDETGIGTESATVDILRNPIPDWQTSPVFARYDRVHPCSLSASPGLDAGAAAWGQGSFYYLAALGCPDSCRTQRITGSLGSSSTGPRPIPGPDWDPVCP